MIGNLHIDYKGTFPNKYRYVAADDYGKKHRLLPTDIKFKEGLNLVIGDNGSGKTTLLKLISDFAIDTYGILAKQYFRGDFMGILLKRDAIAFDGGEPVTGINLKFQKDALITRMTRLEEIRAEQGGDSMLSDFKTFGRFAGQVHASSGQRAMDDIVDAVKVFNEERKRNQDKRNLDEFANKIFYADSQKDDKEYFIKYLNEHGTMEGSPVPTFIMDEPDKALSVTNLRYLTGILKGANREGIQVIVSVHNPLVINALAKDANVIELTKGYLKDIQSFIKNPETFPIIKNPGDEEK